MISSGFLRQHLLRRGDLLPAGVVGVVLVLLLVPLLAGELHLLGVDHDDEVAGVAVRGVLRLVLAAEDVRDRDRQPADDQVGRVDHDPLVLDRRRRSPWSWTSFPSAPGRLAGPGKSGTSPVNDRKTVMLPTGTPSRPLQWKGFALPSECLYSTDVTTIAGAREWHCRRPGRALQEYPTFGLPWGSVRGFLSVLICSFFWIVLLLPRPADTQLNVPRSATSSC